MALSFEEMRKEHEQIFLSLEMAIANYQQALQQMEAAEEQEREEEAIFDEFQNLPKEEGRGKGRKMKDLRLKKTFKKKKNKVQNQHDGSRRRGKGSQQRKEASKAEVRRRRGGKVWWGKKGRENVEKSQKVLELDGKKGTFFRDKG